MSLKRSFVGTMVLFAVLASGGRAPANGESRPQAADDTIKITLPEPTVVTKRFDPKRPPAEMPPLKWPEAAETVSAYACQAQVAVQSDTASLRPARGGKIRARVTVTSVDFRGSLAVTIWLPTNATKKIVRHEDGHRQIALMYYEGARQAVADAAGKILGKEYTGTGTTPDAAVKDAIHRAIGEVNEAFMSATSGAAEPVQRRYDEITKHGTNNVPEQEAIDRARREAGKQ